MKALITVFESRNEAIDALKGKDYRQLLVDLDDFLRDEIVSNQSEGYTRAMEEVRDWLRERCPPEFWED